MVFVASIFAWGIMWTASRHALSLSSSPVSNGKLLRAKKIQRNTDVAFPSNVLPRTSKTRLLVLPNGVDAYRILIETFLQHELLPRVLLFS